MLNIEQETTGLPQHDFTYASAASQHYTLCRLEQVQKLLLLSIHGQALFELLTLNAELASHMLDIMLVVESGQHAISSLAEVVDHFQPCFFALQKSEHSH